MEGACVLVCVAVAGSTRAMGCTIHAGVCGCAGRGQGAMRSTLPRPFHGCMDTCHGLPLTGSIGSCCWLSSPCRPPPHCKHRFCHQHGARCDPLVASMHGCICPARRSAARHAQRLGAAEASAAHAPAHPRVAAHWPGAGLAGDLVERVLVKCAQLDQQVPYYSRLPTRMMPNEDHVDVRLLGLRLRLGHVASAPEIHTHVQLQRVSDRWASCGQAVCKCLHRQGIAESFGCACPPRLWRASWVLEGLLLDFMIGAKLSAKVGWWPAGCSNMEPSPPQQASHTHTHTRSCLPCTYSRTARECCS